ncbi:MAG: HAD-IC family P-type ATPase [Patescibacteria group bacterium]
MVKSERWYRFEPAAAAMRLGSDLAAGLAPTEAQRRLTKSGSNALPAPERISLGVFIWRQLKSPLLFILILAGAVTAWLREFADTIVIATVVTLNTGLGAWQEWRAHRAFHNLWSAGRNYAAVIRGGAKSLVPIEKVVVGDLVVLTSGDQVPADGRLIEANNLLVSEAALTGEWLSVFKSIETIHRDVRLTEQANMVWSGTMVTGGRGLVLVTATGIGTELGRIAVATGVATEEATPFQRGIHRLARWISLVIFGLIAVIFALGYWRGVPAGEMLLTSIAIAVAAIPSGLPVAVTVTLAIGLENILRRGGLVKNLLAAETLGNTTVILTDKTGTLTQAKMAVTTVETRSGQIQDRQKTLTIALATIEAFVNNTEETYPPAVVGRPIEKAILLYALDQGLDPNILLNPAHRLDFLPFNSGQRLAVALQAAGHDGNNTLCLLGAPELLLKHSTHYLMAGHAKTMSSADRHFFQSIYEASAARGSRLVAVAYRSVTWTRLLGSNVWLSDLVMAGLIILDDPLRPDVTEAIEAASSAGIKIVMVTGDNAITARKVAEETGIIDVGARVLTGDELEKMSETERHSLIKTGRVFGRMLPEDKLAILQSFRAQGEIVAMTGDGINDAPALRHADIGIALGSGTAVAREAADLVLVNDSFSVIVAAIEEGRRLLDNLKKMSAYLLSTGFSEIIIVGGALTLGLAVPILPTQILWTNVVEEGFMAIAFAFEPGRNLLRRSPQRASAQTILTPAIRRLVLVIAAVTGLLALMIYVFLQSILPLGQVRTIMFALLSVDSLFFAFALKDLARPIWRISLVSNRYLIGGLVASLGFLSLALFVEPVSQLLNVEPLGGLTITLILLFSLVNLIIIETVKYLIFRRYEH